MSTITITITLPKGECFTIITGVMAMQKVYGVPKYLVAVKTSLRVLKLD